MPLTFIEDIKFEISQINSNWVYLMQASSQADSILAKCSADKISNIIMPSDNNIFAHNPKAVIINSFSRSKRCA